MKRRLAAKAVTISFRIWTTKAAIEYGINTHLLTMAGNREVLRYVGENPSPRLLAEYQLEAVAMANFGKRAANFLSARLPRWSHRDSSVKPCSHKFCPSHRCRVPGVQNR